MSSLKDYISQHLRETDQKSDIVYVGIIVGSLLFSTLGGLTLANSYREALAVKAQETDMRTFVTNYNQKLAELNKEPFRAINDEELDEVQSNLLFAVQVNNLELNTLRNLSIQTDMEKEHGKSFEMTLTGAWSDTVNFLKGFGTKDALIAIRNVRLTPESDGRIKTTIEYKICIK